MYYALLNPVLRISNPGWDFLISDVLLIVWFCLLNFSNPGWKNLISDVLLIVWFCLLNFWSGLEKFDIWCVVTCLNPTWIILCSTTRRRTSLCRRECNTEHSRWRWDLQCEPRTPATAGRRRNDATHSGSQKRHGTVSSSLLVSLSL